MAPPRRKDPVPRPQPLQLRRDLALCGRGVNSAPIPAPADPADQRRQPDPKITRDLAPRATTGLHQADRFLLKFLRKPSLLCHRVPHSSSGTLHFSDASPYLRALLDALRASCIGTPPQCNGAADAEIATQSEGPARRDAAG